MIARRFFPLLLLFTGAVPALQAKGLFDSNAGVSVQTSSPRETLQSFMVAMDRYATGKRKGDLGLESNIGNAIECLNLESVPLVNRAHDGRETAIFLEEIIDRLFVVDYRPGARAGGGRRWQTQALGVGWYPGSPSA